MAINGNGGNGFPQPVLDVIEQVGFLETKLRKSILPTMAFREGAGLDWFDARIGETKTFTRSALIAPNINPLNPALNTGLDNGMTADARSFEQWVATLFEWPGFIPTNIYGQTAFIGNLYIDNMEKLAQKAGNSLELVCIGRVFKAYDSGDTFATGAESGQNVHVDNINGFDTQYPVADLPSYKAPVATSSVNKIPIVIVSNATGNITYTGVNVTAVTPDTINTSYMQSGNQPFGQSGTLTLDAGSLTIAKGDRIVAVDAASLTAGVPPAVGLPLDPRWKDGSYVVRPLNAQNQMISTGFAMQNTSTMNPSVQIPYAVSVLERRGVPKLANGLYGCAIDSTLMASFYGDTGFQRATATRWDQSAVFVNGQVAAGWGVEFVKVTQMPVYSAPAGGFSLRHAAVFGAEALTEHPFVGARDAQNIVAGVGDIADERWMNRIKFRSLAAIDTLGQVIKVSYDYMGDFECGTDKSSNPTIVLASDYARYKRIVLLQAASQF